MILKKNSDALKQKYMEFKKQTHSLFKNVKIIAEYVISFFCMNHNGFYIKRLITIVKLYNEIDNIQM